MDKRYIELFTLIAQTTANLAEQVMEEHEKNGEEKGRQTAETMRNDFLNLHDKLGTDEVLNKADYARLLVGAIIVTNQLNARIENEQKALQGYKIDIIPKLDQINNAETTDITELAESLFEIKEDVESNEKDSK
mgnify:CR=1 FL=1